MTSPTNSIDSMQGHSSECWRDHRHHACAVAEIERLRKEKNAPCSFSCPRCAEWSRFAAGDLHAGCTFYCEHCKAAVVIEPVDVDARAEFYRGGPLLARLRAALGDESLTADDAIERVGWMKQGIVIGEQHPYGWYVTKYCRWRGWLYLCRLSRTKTFVWRDCCVEGWWPTRAAAESAARAANGAKP